ncbi:MAG: sulfur carrier protein ThiS adenylyltransferase ThiF [Clostridiales bacterium]|nr:sulfur carrier protein ThiS adenylyltransferase ThiF [Clostridiales bacterium]
MTVTKEEFNEALAARHGQARFEAFSKAVVAICGLGGLGSNIAVNLTRAGIGKLILIDFDRVDTANLNRQQYKISQVGMYKTEATEVNLREISPAVEIKIHTCKVAEENIRELLSEADIICEAFDKADQKAMLVDGVLTLLPGKPLITGNGMASFRSPNLIKTRRVMKDLYVCGDGVNDVADGEGLAAPRVNICASHQALTVLRILTGEIEDEE